MHSLWHASLIQILCGNYAAANAFADELVGLADEKGALFWKAWGNLNQGCVLALLGKADASAQLISRAVAATPFCFAYMGENTAFLALIRRKNSRCAPTARNGTTGGVKLQATMSGAEIEIDRPGCDYQNFPAVNQTTHAIDSQVCLFSCAEDNRCQAWNFDPRAGSKGTCFLKNCVPPPIVPVSTGVESGVKFAPPSIAHAPPTTK
jgi:hypothetical protein